MRYTLVIIGTGNVATALSLLFGEEGHTIVQVYGRDRAKAVALAKRCNAEPVSDLALLSKDADLYIIAVSDNAVPAIAASLQLGDKLLVHTAGSVSREVLKHSSKNYGVLYPLQSLRAELDHVTDIPFLVDANTAEKTAWLKDIAMTVSMQVQTATDEQRLHLHVAAVVVSNFTNHLYALAESYCNKENVDFRMLLPLISEVANRIQHVSPHEVQTGPAVRNDQSTIGKHLELLQDFPELQQLYAAFSSSIEKMYRK
ncbi:Rossmann-like and DUF2520 domain-containing protein [Pseudobacter ginsenosidimutans]|jgi:predicted short-subunit dehydrogenase-like oxidoreductase (DUF2520 family)|uniref:Putative short-subunit dehydrogenase-like oxidoreductase (DUF2520 family) n=1 Tax=Pseudobacter ginsenosidimutans TaxID=661488 RepID=A0A4Q7N4M8_9BACT|nr:Rossmann-like and DUF2520 domain-containing protein [Pseudobacter ginsenosidimutans]QEC44501.1 DUF2520 domain-containing protein [Pseudobacter ginsenosidimutans]RZS75972.1 putative short-subunit dehydrogenase-like oxidoreductase (DUF2520 family) [Pseudobacter ginsenosidimutans]